MPTGGTSGGPDEQFMVFLNCVLLFVLTLDSYIFIEVTCRKEIKQFTAWQLLGRCPDCISRRFIAWHSILLLSFVNNIIALRLLPMKQ